MELYILSKQDLSILSICKVSEYQINLDEETNAKTTFNLLKTDGIKKDNFIVLNGLYRQFLFVIDDVQTNKSSNLVTVTALDISNIFNQKVIEKNTEQMTTNSIEEFLANTISENFVNSDDTISNIGYIDIAWHTDTQGVVATNAENGLYNFHTFMTNCRQYKNIYTEFTFDNGRLKIDIENKEESVQLIDTTLPEVTDYNKIYEEDVTAKVTVLIRENGSEYNLYLKTDRTTTTDKKDPDRVKGKVEVISVDTADKAAEEALNVIRGNSYNHLVEFKIAKTSKLMDISKFTIGRPVRIKTDDDIYDSYISAITLSDENFVYFKSGKLRATFLEKIKKSTNNAGNKLDLTGGVINGNLDINGDIKQNGESISHPNAGKMIWLYPTQNQWIPATTQVELEWQAIHFNNANGALTKEGNGVAIGENVKCVHVNATYRIYGNEMFIYLFKNSELIAAANTTQATGGQIHINNVISVEAGDVITVRAYLQYEGSTVGDGSPAWSYFKVTVIA